MKKILRYMNFNVAVRFIGLILVVIFQSSISLAEVPGLINYQGRLTESGVPVTGTRSMTFRIYDAASGGNKLWEETRTVAVNNGVFSIKLGEITPIPKEKFSGGSTYLETEVSGVKLGRERLVTVPYAYHSAVADSVSTTGSLTMTSPLRLQNTSLQFQDTVTGGLFDIVDASNILMFRRITSPDWSTSENRIEIHPGGVQINASPGGALIVSGRLVVDDYSYFKKTAQFYEYSYFYAGKSGYVVDIFKNVSGNVLHRGDLVKLSDKNAIEYYGKDNLIPISGIELSDTSEDTRVIGFVVGKAKGFKKGEEPPKEGEDLSAVQPGEYASIVTLGTFAICKVDTTNGPIKIGDLLTSSSNPGYAMKAKEPKIGTIIGKALQNLDSGTGTIGVLVGAR